MTKSRLRAHRLRSLNAAERLCVSLLLLLVLVAVIFELIMVTGNPGMALLILPAGGVAGCLGWWVAEGTEVSDG